jgi:hypothetical protein
LLQSHSSIELDGRTTNADGFAKAVALVREYEAHIRLLQESLAQVREAEDPSKNELDNIISSFIGNTQPEEDKCPARLLEAKHQLNNLLKAIHDMGMDINSTELELKGQIQEDEGAMEALTLADTICAEKRNKCAQEKASNTELWIKLKKELHILYLIANPSSFKSSEEIAAVLKSVEVGNGNSLLQEGEKRAAGTTALQQQHTNATIRPHSVNIAGIQGAEQLVETTKVLAEDLAKCMSNASTASLLEGTKDLRPNCKHVDVGFVFQTGGDLTPDLTSIPAQRVERNDVSEHAGTFCLNITSACGKQLDYLESTYVKAYVEISRLVAQYDRLINATSCEDEVNEDCALAKTPHSDKIAGLGTGMDNNRKKLEDLRPRLEAARETLDKLRDHVSLLTAKCHELPATNTALDKVRDVLYVLGECPGLGLPKFHVPLFIAWKLVRQPATSTGTDAEIDAAMATACSQFVKDGLTARAAEVGEIGEQTIEGMPLTNTNTVAVVGKCTTTETGGLDTSLCAGDQDPTDIADVATPHASGHARKCWRKGEALDMTKVATDCSIGDGNIYAMCVVDRANADALSEHADPS